MDGENSRRDESRRIAFKFIEILIMYLKLEPSLNPQSLKVYSVNPLRFKVHTCTRTEPHYSTQTLCNFAEGITVKKSLKNHDKFKMCQLYKNKSTLLCIKFKMTVYFAYNHDRVWLALQYSLEGHQFAVFDFCLTADFRYIVSISNKFITWDLSTSDLTRDVNPGLEGIMQQLCLSPDNRYAAAYTNNNQARSHCNLRLSF